MTKTMRNFDKQHSEYRNAAFIRILHNMQTKFINTVRFEGDDEFTIAHQRAMFKALFIHGTAGIFNYKKAIISRVANINNQYISYIIPALDYIVDSDRKVVQVTGTYFDDTERVVEGTGITLPRANVGQKAYKITRKDTAIMQYSTDFTSGYILWMPIAYMIATAETVAKKRVTLMDEKMASNNGNNSISKKEFSDIYDVDASFVKLQPSTNSYGSDNVSMKIQLEDLLKTKIAKLNLSGGETLTDLLEYMKEYKSYVDHQMGIRSNTNKKGERNISSEFTSEEIHWAIMENDIKEQAEMFALEYEKLYGKKLTVIHMSDVVVKKQEEQEIKIANGGINESKNNTEDI